MQINKSGSRIVMPGAGRTTTRAWTEADLVALAALAARHELQLGALLDLVGTQAIDVSMNGTSGWTGVPSRVWTYVLGGHQVLKKWLSYREADILGRPLSGEEALQFSRAARRITEMLCMGPALDAHHALARDAAGAWDRAREVDQLNHHWNKA